MRVDLSLGLGANRADPLAHLLAGATDLEFAAGRYRLDGAFVPEATVEGYHTRTSSRYAQDAGGTWNLFGTGEAAILPGVGYDHREAHNNLSPNGLNPQSISDSGATSSAEPGTFLGFSSAARVASAGSAWHRKRDDLSSALASGSSYGFSFIYAEGTSPNAAFIIRNSTTDQHCYLSGAHGALTNTTADCGTITDVDMTEVAAGVWLVEGVFNCTTVGAAWSAGVGPHSTVVGEDIVLVAQQVADKPFPMPFVSGGTANERLEIPAADTGMAVDLMTTGVTVFWRGRIGETDANYRAAFEHLIDGSNRFYFQRNGTNNRLEVVAQRVAGYLTLASSASLVSVLEAGEVVFGVTLRPDGSTRAVAADSGFVNMVGQTLPSGVATWDSIGSFNGSPSANGTTRRVLTIPKAVSDAEFDALHARIAA